MIPGEGLRWAGDREEQRGDGLGWVCKESYAATSNTQEQKHSDQRRE